MRFIKKIFIDGEEFPLIGDNLMLEEGTAGRAIFVVESKQNLSGIVRYYVGYAPEYELYFTGIIETCVAMDEKQRRLMVREPAAVLQQRWPIARRHISAADILEQLSIYSGLEFILQEAEWAEFIIPGIAHAGSGAALIDQLGRELEVYGFIWQSQPDGSVYVGQRRERGLEIAETFCSQVTVKGAALPLVPAIRPGLKLTIGAGSDPRLVKAVEISQETMRLQF